LGVLHFKRGDADEAVRLMKRSLELKPDDPNFMQNLGGMLNELGRRDEAIRLLEEAVERDPENFTALSNLCTTLHDLGADDLAQKYGQRSIEAKDRQACQAFAEKYGEVRLACQPRPFDPTDRRKNLIAFSLWGTDRYYISGAIENASLAKHLYPEWMCRFYVDVSIPRSVIEQLVGHGANVVQFREPVRGNYGLFWRFFAANDTAADRFLCRDCDCRLNVKERVAVEEWIASNQCFHILRDNVIHTELILAGMWGGVTGVLPDLEKKSKEYIQNYGERWADQHFLREEIWPLIKDHALTHDAYYRLGNSQPFPRFGTLPGKAHVGGSTPRPSR
jgi:tetratricopeptide (TPR) repeat protein